MIIPKYLKFTRFELKLIKFCLLHKPSFLDPGPDDDKSELEEKGIVIYDRSLLIRPEYIGFRFLIHIGNKFISLVVTSFNVGDRFGDYGYLPITRVINRDKKKKIKAKKKDGVHSKSNKL